MQLQQGKSETERTFERYCSQFPGVVVRHGDNTYLGAQSFFNWPSNPTSQRVRQRIEHNGYHLQLSGYP